MRKRVAASHPPSAPLDSSPHHADDATVQFFSFLHGLEKLTIYGRIMSNSFFQLKRYRRMCSWKSVSERPPVHQHGRILHLHQQSTVRSRLRAESIHQSMPRFDLFSFSRKMTIDIENLYRSDVDECARSTHECKRNQLCQNRPGGYVCSCQPGYTIGANRECEDVDECTRFAGKVCSPNSQCANTAGSYRCDCKEGFRQGADPRSCVGNVIERQINPVLIVTRLYFITKTLTSAPKRPGSANRRAPTRGDRSSAAAWPATPWPPTKGPARMWTSANSTKIEAACASAFASTSRAAIRAGAPMAIDSPPTIELAKVRQRSMPKTIQSIHNSSCVADIDECARPGVCRAEETCLNTRGGYYCNAIVCPPNYVRDTEHRK